MSMKSAALKFLTSVWNSLKQTWVIVLVSTPFVYFFLYKIFQEKIIKTVDYSEEITVYNYSYAGIQWSALLSSVWLFGALGATASYMGRVKETTHYEPIFLPQIAGVIFSSVLALIFLGGLVSGSLFPDFSEIGGWVTISLPIKDWAKLLVWCFVAGFFERFVPDMLKSFVKSRDKTQN
jgi:hypothetical protein